MNGRFEVKLWVVIVFIVLVASLCLGGCSLSKPTNLGLLGTIPPVDAFNNDTGEPGSDGKVDLAHIQWVAEKKAVVDAATGGAAAPATGTAESLYLSGAALIALLVHYLKTKKEFELTDKNVATVAEHAKVPEEKLV